jgi:hypothetical protein
MLGGGGSFTNLLKRSKPKIIRCIGNSASLWIKKRID